ncbi:MAG: indole-3-glycerol phosphate synthase TrpC [Prevotellaceae bacterium]|nr:indole-3-glycerol phosphate synthase TrpC [Prevotellaceae bacterium]
MAHKRIETADRKTNKPRSMSEALRQSPTGIIAEFKRRSPSRDWLHRTAAVSEIIPAYRSAGATALSILTDEHFFGGSLHDLQTARPLTDLPILRKDFITDEFQLYEAKFAGADTILLIAAALKRRQCTALQTVAHSLGLEVLLEIHSENELDYITPDTDMIGVNNRHLGTFHTDTNISFRLAERLPKDKIWVSESGLSDSKTLIELRRCGYKGFLIGEAFMKTNDPGGALAEFIKETNHDATID